MQVLFPTTTINEAGRWIYQHQPQLVSKYLKSLATNYIIVIAASVASMTNKLSSRDNKEIGKELKKKIRQTLSQSLKKS